MSETTVVFMGQGENAEWCVSGTTVGFVVEEENAKWCVSGTVVLFVGKGMRRTLSGG